MPRKATLKGLQSIIRHNIKQFLDKQKLTKKEYNEVIKLAEEYLGNASHEDLKQKGIVQKIINGGMKRPSESDGNKSYKRSVTQRVIDSLRLIPFNDEKAADEGFKQSVINICSEEKAAVKNYQRTEENLKRAILDKNEAETQLYLVVQRKKLLTQEMKFFYNSKHQFIEKMLTTHSSDIEYLQKYDKPRESYNGAQTINKMLINDFIYYAATGEHLPNIKETLQRYNVTLPEDSLDEEASSSVQPPPPNDGSSSSSQLLPPPPNDGASSSSQRLPPPPNDGSSHPPQHQQASLEERLKRQADRLQQLNIP